MQVIFTCGTPRNADTHTHTSTPLSSITFTDFQEYSTSQSYFPTWCVVFGMHEIGTICPIGGNGAFGGPWKSPFWNIRHKTKTKQCQMFFFTGLSGFFGAWDSGSHDRALSTPRRCLDAQKSDREKGVTRSHRAPVAQNGILGPQNPRSVTFGTGKRVITKGVFSLEESQASQKSQTSLNSREYGWLLLYFPQSGGSLKSLESLNSLESLENGLFWKDPFSKRPLFPNPKLGGAWKQFTFMHKRSQTFLVMIFQFWGVRNVADLWWQLFLQNLSQEKQAWQCHRKLRHNLHSKPSLSPERHSGDIHA